MYNNIDSEQGKLTNMSIDKAIISGVYEECLSLRSKAASYDMLFSFLDKQSKIYYSSSNFVQKEIVEYIRDTYVYLLEQALKQITIDDYSFTSYSIFEQIRNIIYNSKIVKNEFLNISKHSYNYTL